ncbi:acetyltransferase [Pseudovibrio sp. Ad5]|uniref:GNAT family N-acetyltransferase n=1 Tax=Pseudovibrio sp. Ad5 TaxID=989436 RepID=UPI0007AEDBEC|nr:GNAT family N-acetyltransferase [Pseudovibrio sp. Ad5]KZK96382.1 acetyltransferase [Pseudovibrio sp. Ad5]
MNIIRARAQHISEMNEVILSAKGHWGYSQEMMDVWLPDLIVDAVVLANRHFWVLEAEGRIVGVFSISVDAEQRSELEDFWVSPQLMGRGAGRIMFGFIQNWLQDQQLPELVIVSDPHAKGFYERMGAEEIGFQPSLPAGRKLPVMRYVLEPRPLRTV